MVGDDDNEEHHFIDGDSAVVVRVSQLEDLSRDAAAAADDAMEGLRRDGIISADEIRDRLQQLHNARLLLDVATQSAVFGPPPVVATETD